VHAAQLNKQKKENAHTTLLPIYIRKYAEVSKSGGLFQGGGYINLVTELLLGASNLLCR